MEDSEEDLIKLQEALKLKVEGKLTLLEYQPLTKRTCPDILGSLACNLSHMGQGITSEMSELIDAIETNDVVNIAEELADTMWYLSNWCTFRGYSLERLTLMSVDNVQINKGIIWHACEISDLSKKLLAYGKQIKEVEEGKLLAGLLQCIINECNTYNINLGKALFNNIAKLTVRFPDEFNEFSAKNRDLIIERIALEK